jgi:GntR family transcriptional regulator
MSVDKSLPPIEFRLDSRSGVPAYLQLVQQVKHAIRLGLLRPGDQLPTVKQVVAKLVINPNTVLKAYRALDHEGLVEGRRGEGTFVTAAAAAANPVSDHKPLRDSLERWLRRAREAGLDEDAINAIFAQALHALLFEEAA